MKSHSIYSIRWIAIVAVYTVLVSSITVTIQQSTMTVACSCQQHQSAPDFVVPQTLVPSKESTTTDEEYHDQPNITRSVEAVMAPSCAPTSAPTNPLNTVATGAAPESKRDVTFLYGIFSMIDDPSATDPTKHKMQRDAQRSTILTSLPTEKLCSLQHYVEAIDRGEATACRILYTFVVGGADASSDRPMEHLPSDISQVALSSTRLNDEADVVYLNIRENMNDGKTPTWFKYAAGLVEKYNIDYVGKGDSDTLLWFPHLLTMMDRDLPHRPLDKEEDNRRIYSGWMVDSIICGFNDYCKTLKGKVYMSGQFFFLSSDLVVFSTEERIDRSIPVRHEDFDFGMRLLSHPLPIKLQPLTGYQIWRHQPSLKNHDQWMSAWNMYRRNGPPLKSEDFWPALKRGKAPAAPPRKIRIKKTA